VELLELQRIDSTISRLEHRKFHLPEQQQLEALYEKVDAIRRRVGDAQALADDAAFRQKRLDGDLDTLNRKIAAEEEKLFSGKVANPKELSALQAEVESFKRRRAGIEDSDLEVMEEREAAEAQLAALKAEAEHLEHEVSEVTTARDAAAEGIDAGLVAAGAERGAWAAKFDEELLGYYADLRSSKGGVAIARLVDGACQGCHMKLPAQEVNEMRKADGMVRCVECGRILVVAMPEPAGG